MVSSRSDPKRKESLTQRFTICYKDHEEAASYLQCLFTESVEINYFLSSMLTIKNMDNIKMVT